MTFFKIMNRSRNIKRTTIVYIKIKLGTCGVYCGKYTYCDDVINMDIRYGERERGDLKSQYNEPVRSSSSFFSRAMT
jgi:hypothetical protein